MENKIGIINYGVAGNIASVKKTIDRAGGSSIIIDNPKDFELIDKVVIPGVGSFKDAMLELKNDNFLEPLLNFDRPILGICLGMQIMAKLGYEYGKTDGMGMIDGQVKRIACSENVPHIGFKKIKVTAPNILLNDIEEEEFYFMHSFEILDCKSITSITQYGNHTFVSSICKSDIFGVQFHPEKSRDAGIKLFKNFIEI